MAAIKFFSITRQSDCHWIPWKRQWTLFAFLIQVLFLSAQVDQKPNNAHFIIKNIEIQGNKSTKDFIIYRELLFKVGDTLSNSSLNEKLMASKNNLTNLSLFNFVNIDTLHWGVDEIKVTIKVLERWYLWPIPVLEIPNQELNTWLKTTDLSRINYGVWFTKENFRGRGEVLKFMVGLGFDEQLGVSYSVPFINKKLTTGFSFNASYYQNHQTLVKLMDNKTQYLKLENQYVKKTFSIGAGIQIRKNLYHTHEFKISYQQDIFADTLIRSNPDYTGNSSSNNHYVGFYYKYKNDFRDNKSYPLTGHYFDVEFSQFGFDFLKDNIDYGFLHASFRRYFLLHKGIYLHFSLNGLYNYGASIPLYLQRMVGNASDEVSGYEYYVIPCHYAISLRGSLKKTLVKPRVFQIGFLPWEKFSKIHYAIYGNFFYNYAYLHNQIPDPLNPLNGDWLFSTGVGIDFVTYYDKVFRFELSLNRKSELGFFIHLKSPL